MDTLKRIEKIIRESAFDKKIKNPGLKFNPGLALTGVRTTGLCRKPNTFHILWVAGLLGRRLHSKMAKTPFVCMRGEGWGGGGRGKGVLVSFLDCHLPVHRLTLTDPCGSSPDNRRGEGTLTSRF